MFKETKNYSSFSPMIVPVAENETEEEFLLRWKKFDALPKEIKSKLSASETLREMENVKRIFNLELSQVASISRLIRSYYFGEVKIENFVSILSKEMEIDLSKAQEIAKHITEKIINQRIQSNSGAGDEAIVKLPILEALKKYPKLGNQRISVNNIKLKIFPDPVRPSIKNWIADYRQVMGTGNYGAIEKSNYLFHGENAKKLNSQELQKLSLILKSLDGHIPLTINAKDQQVVFPLLEANEEAARSKHYATSKESEIKTPRMKYLAKESNEPEIRKIMPNSQTAKQPNKNNTGSFRFSSPQTLESEKEGKKKIKVDKKEKIDKVNKINKASKVSKNPRYYQIYPMGINHNSEKEESRPKTKGNVVNLREDF
ncbi:hypothetical protein J7J13_01445 [bacterium]|nr:hypothetical protein [bacterium]